MISAGISSKRAEEAPGSATSPLLHDYMQLTGSHGVSPVLMRVLRCTGTDRLDFLHRLSTNDLKALGEFTVRDTVVTTEKGRIVERCSVANLRTETLLISECGTPGALQAWLEKFIFTEDVHLEDVTATIDSFTIDGPQADSIIRAAFPGAGDEAIVASGPSEQILVWQEPGRRPARCICLLRGEKGGTAATLFETLPDGIYRCSGTEAAEILRIEGGVPLNGKELTGEVNPLEAHLTNLVSFTKGCYIGQEVIARTDTYGKLRRKLAHLHAGEADPALLPGMRIVREGADIGWVTSSCISYARHTTIALCFVQASAEPGGVEVVSKASSRPISAQLHLIPNPGETGGAP